MEKTKQILKGNVVTYITEDGWEDPNPIDISYSYNIVYPKKRKSRFDCIYTNNVFFNVLINNYIGRKLFFKATKDIRKILLDEASRKFTIDMIRKHGSLYKYQQARIKRRYGNNFTFGDYQNMISVSAGFKNRWDREMSRLRKRGIVKNYNERGLYFARKLGYKTRNDYYLALAKRQGYSSVREMYYAKHPEAKERVRLRRKELRRLKN